METTLKNICAEHGLSAISVLMHNTDTAGYTTVFVHWADDITVTRCARGTANTFDDALDFALIEKNAIVSEAA
ncbi:hypothetical protein BRY73_02990 [Ochrobactrum sp. P6BS-III]|uniref:hypothetical protein n=1 Tax=unclassified Ochrobactrum TaxID=239106 RepID=UPI000991F695|nr:hypothetical protein [Ochrobactrum sp. P6BSIII]OOL20143.1 hypothetical protein BRY73_02990 [Ochrobactrum sp. P6BS-III]